MNWTDNRIDWSDDTSTMYDSNSVHDVKWQTTPKEEKVYRNGNRLKKGEQRPAPFWLDLDELLLPSYTVIVARKIFRRRICGAYSRKYDRVRKFRKKRLL